MANKNWQSVAHWILEDGKTEFVSTDYHSTKLAAESVIYLLNSEGLGGDKQIFPHKTFIKDLRK